MKHWIHAFRLRTLPLAVSSILVGSALAAFYSEFRGPVFGLALLTAVLLQVLSNLANDLGDHLHGTDNDVRVGPQRTVQSGAISPAAMKRAMWICGALALASGIALIVVALGLTTVTLVFLVIGLLAIGAAVKYTYGNNPYGYAGFGDISVLLFFGLAGVIGTFYLHTASFVPSTILPALGIGLLAAGVLNLNNMRDIHNDAASGKRTVVVRLGWRAAKAYHLFLILGGTTCLVVWSLLHLPHGSRVIVFIPMISFITHPISVVRQREPRSLDPELKRLALSIFVWSLFFAFTIWNDLSP